MASQDAERAANADRAIASRESPSQQEPPPPPAAAPAPPALPAPPQTVPESTTPKAAPAPAPRQKLPQLGEAFVDRFDGGELHDRWAVSDGWSNGDFTDNDWRRSQVSFGKHGLVLTMEPGPEDSSKKLASAEIRTSEFYRYGYFEVRAKLPRDPGIVVGLFTYAPRDEARRPNEIDVEILGRDTRTLEATIHENGKATHSAFTLPFDSADGFHTYGIDWRPNSVRWYVDGKLMLEQTGGAATRLVRPQQFLMSLWGSEMLKQWVGPLNLAGGPWKLEISCVAYSPSYSDQSKCSAVS